MINVLYVSVKPAVRLCGKAWLLAVRPQVYEHGTFTE